MTEVIRVAVAVIINSESQTLLSVRHKDAHQGGKWEFPGGKIESGETTEQALKRELFEELNIRVTSSEPFILVTHRYPEKTVVLDVLKVLDYDGEAIGKEGQQVDWIDAKQLPELNFPDANFSILEKLLKLLN